MTPAQTAESINISGYSSSSKGVSKQIQEVGQIDQVTKTVRVDLALNCTCEAIPPQKTDYYFVQCSLLNIHSS